MRRGSSNSGDGRRLIFVGTQPDLITIHFVKHNLHTGIMKLKKVQLTHSDTEVISWWFTSLNSLLNPTKSRPSRLLVFINPFGGHGTAKQIWENKVASVFQIAGITSTVIVTENSEHADNVIQSSSSLHNYDGIISVGGDGMFSQVKYVFLSPVTSHLNLNLVRYSTLCWCGRLETGSWTWRTAAQSFPGQTSGWASSQPAARTPWPCVSTAPATPSPPPSTSSSATGGRLTSPPSTPRPGWRGS